MLPRVRSGIFRPGGISDGRRLGTRGGLGNSGAHYAESLIHIVGSFRIVSVDQHDHPELLSGHPFHQALVARRHSVLTDSHLLADMTDTIAETLTALPIRPQPLHSLHLAHRRAPEDL